MSTTIKTKLTRYIYNINGDKIKKIKGVFDQNSCSGGVIMINPSQPIPKDSHHKSQDIITSLTSYYVWPFKACWQQKVTHTHTLIKYAQSSATSSIWTNVIQNQFLADIAYIACMDSFVATNS